MARLTTAPARRVYAAAALARDHALLSAGSLCSPPDRTWTGPALEELAGRVRAAISGEGSFSTRWAAALCDASPRVVRLAAEVLALHLLVATDVAPATKRRLVSATVTGEADPPVLVAGVDEALDGGLVPAGAAFGFQRCSQLLVVIEAARALRRMPVAERTAIIDGPWTWRDLLGDLDVVGGHAQRAALAHLLHPATFEPILSRRLKLQVVEELGDCLETVPSDPDRALLAIRRALRPIHGRSFSLVDAEVRATASR